MYSTENTQLILNNLYEQFHLREFVQPDPLQFLYHYPKLEDREIVGLLASSLALGRVNAIIEIIEKVLTRIPSPHEYLVSLKEKEIKDLFPEFKYRFYDQEDLVSLLLAIKRILEEYGSLNMCFVRGYKQEDINILPALTFFVESLSSPKRLKMLANPSKGSACKRLMLYLRWMIREDIIDPGGWQGIPRSKLVIPLDTHMFKVGKILNLTGRNDAGMKTALEITEGLKKYNREDPVSFDFSLTRPGIHPDLNYDVFISET
jgi:uncharacterized protein (TIGR02757 family)